MSQLFPCFFLSLTGKALPAPDPDHALSFWRPRRLPLKKEVDDISSRFPVDELGHLVSMVRWQIGSVHAAVLDCYARPSGDLRQSIAARLGFALAAEMRLREFFEPRAA